MSTDFVLRTAYHDHTGQIPDTEEARIAKAKERYLKAATIQGEVVERLVSASDDFTMYLWEPSKGTKPIARMIGHQKQVNHVTFSPDGLLIASAGFDNHTKIWNARDGKFINTLRGHVAPVYQCCFSADSRLLVTASKDTTLKGDMRTHKLANGTAPFHCCQNTNESFFLFPCIHVQRSESLIALASVQNLQAPNTFKPAEVISSVLLIHRHVSNIFPICDRSIWSKMC